MTYPAWCHQVLSVEQIGEIMQSQVEVYLQNKEAAKSSMTEGDLWIVKLKH